MIDFKVWFGKEELLSWNLFGVRTCIIKEPVFISFWYENSIFLKNLKLENFSNFNNQDRFKMSAVYSFEILRDEFKLVGKVSFGNFPDKEALPGQYVYKTVGVQWFYDNDHDDGQVSLIHLIHNKQLDSKRLIKYLLYCDFNKENSMVKEDNQYSIQFNDDNIKFNIIEGNGITCSG